MALNVEARAMHIANNYMNGNITDACEAFLNTRQPNRDKLAILMPDCLTADNYTRFKAALFRAIDKREADKAPRYGVVRRTSVPELGYIYQDAGLWRFVDLQDLKPSDARWGMSVVGEQYKTKAELLAAFPDYARSWGYTP